MTDLVGTAEAARLIGVNRNTLSRWVAGGRITAAVELAGRTGARLFHRSEVERVAAEYRAGELGKAPAGSVAS